MSAAYISLTVSANVSPASFHKWKYNWKLWHYVITLRASMHERLEPQQFFFLPLQWNLSFNGSERMDSCFTASFFQTQNASFSGWCGGHALAGGGNVTWKNIPACKHKWKNNCTATSLCLPFQSSAHVMDQDLKIFNSERLITEVEKRPALYYW